ncbi:MAG: sulfite exporter TauE/SafE family protein [Actinobacteria bacterium]|nr:sulfite exporter TauE/SafE family protein [Actinomycetota bacterium]
MISLAYLYEDATQPPERSSGPVNWLAILAIGAAVGFLGGLFGKGGSAIATPLLHLAGVPAIVAVAAPLPATIPSTLAATLAYWREELVDNEVLRWSVAVGVPATAIGAFLTRWISGGVLVHVTDVVVAGLGIRFLVWPNEHERSYGRPERYRLRLASVAAVVGVASGLLANSGGFLLAPLYLTVLRMPIKASFATSLAVAAVLAVPGTVVHWALGHIDWDVVLVFGAASIPLSYVGARVALWSNPARLERIYGAVLAVLGLGLLFA